MTSTPWGTADSHEHIAEGIDFFGTPSHGGIRLSPEKNKLVPLNLREQSFNQQGMDGWYEEDCDVYIVIATFPSYFTADEAQASFEYVNQKYGIKSILTAF